MKSFYAALHQTSEAAGIKILSDEYCCQLLAWVYAFGSHHESVVLGTMLNPDIQAAERRLGIEGCAIVDADLLLKLQGYCKEVEGYLSGDTQYRHPQWAVDIFKKYKIKPLL